MVMSQKQGNVSQDKRLVASKWYDPNCRTCPRLASYLDETKKAFPDYFCRPVPSFGDRHAKLLIVGLAPGKHGANATGRPFTGDHAGVLLYRTLYQYGLTNKPESIARGDGLQLYGCRVTNAVKCLPPENRPIGSEVRNCIGFIGAEVQDLPKGAVILALGKIAHDAVIRTFKLRLATHKFRHGGEIELADDRILLSSYHCSRYNTQTRRLTEKMFAIIISRAKHLSGLG